MRRLVAERVEVSTALGRLALYDSVRRRARSSRIKRYANGREGLQMVKAEDAGGHDKLGRKSPAGVRSLPRGDHKAIWT